jgi:hypothetical protein
MLNIIGNESTGQIVRTVWKVGSADGCALRVISIASCTIRRSTR